MKLPRHMENVLKMLNNAGDVFKLLAQKENTSFTVDMRVIFHINDILNDSLSEVFNASLWKILQRVYLTTRISTSLTVQ